MRYLIIIFLFYASALQAQSDGVVIHEVTRLERIAEPPGGLIPYRVGVLWGYADSTGRLHIKPSIEWRRIQETVFFKDGFASIRASSSTAFALQSVVWLDKRNLTPRQQQYDGYRLWILNARGELLRVRQSEAAVLQPDGSLICLPRTKAYGQMELIQSAMQPWEHTGFSNTSFRRISSDRASENPSAILYKGDKILYKKSIGEHRVTWEKCKPDSETKGGIDQMSDVDCIYALADEDGHRLTPYRYTYICPFSEGMAIVEKTDRVHTASKAPSHSTIKIMYGYINKFGKETIPAGFDKVSPFKYGRAVVKVNDLYGIINSKGRYILSLQSHFLSDPDEEGFIRETLPSSDGEKGTVKSRGHIRYLPPPGKPGFADIFDDDGPFYQGRAWVKQNQRVGLIDQTGHWITTQPYEQLSYPHWLRSESNQIEAGASLADEDAEAWRTSAMILPRYPTSDSLYLIGRRNRKYCLVNRQTGLEVVPAIYDTVLFNPCQGIACLRRAGRDYLVSAYSGHEVEANYRGVDFLTAEGRRLYVTRTNPRAWALADTTARLCSAWIPGTGYPTPEGWMVSREEKSYSLRKQDGSIAYFSTNNIVQPEYEALFLRVWQSLSYPSSRAPYWRLPLVRKYTPQGLFFVYDDTHHQIHILDSRLRELSPIKLPHAKKEDVQVLPSGWSYLGIKQGHPSGHEVTAESPSQLFSDIGEKVFFPSNILAAYYFSFDYPQAWQKYGVLPTTMGFMTRNFRNLWK